MLPHVALMSLVKARRCNIPASPRLSAGGVGCDDRATVGAQPWDVGDQAL